MIRWVFKWLFRLFILAVALVVIFLLSLNSILRVAIEHNIRTQTGMDTEIGHFEWGWTEPTIEIRDLTIYNSAAFGGTPFLNIPEIHIEYDRTALLKKEIHLRLLRFNLAELDIVKNQNGRVNIYPVSKTAPKKSSGGAAAPSFKKQTGYAFESIDALNVSFNKAKYIDLQNPGNDREQVFGIQNFVVPHVKSANDLGGLVLLIGLQSHHFFDPLLADSKKPAALQSILKMMDAAF